MRKCEETETTRTGTAGEMLALSADHECMCVFERNGIHHQFVRSHGTDCTQPESEKSVASSFRPTKV